MKQWYVVARENKDGDFHVDVFGPFINHIDAQVFALDIANDNGWGTVEAQKLNYNQAAKLATKQVIWPYTGEAS